MVSDFGERTIYYEPEDSSIEGCIDSVKVAGKGKFSASGWVYDWNSDQTPLPIHIYVGGEAGTPGIPCYIIQADKERRDVAEACFVGDHQEFSETLTTDRFGLLHRLRHENSGWEFYGAIRAYCRRGYYRNKRAYRI